MAHHAPPVYPHVRRERQHADAYPEILPPPRCGISVPLARGFRAQRTRGGCRCAVPVQRRHLVRPLLAGARTDSRHYIADARFRAVIRASLEREAAMLEARGIELLAHSPFAERDASPR